MTLRRHVPLLLATGATVLVACGSIATELSSVPYGFLTFVAQTSATGHTGTSIGTFYDASGLGVPTATAAWDSCRLLDYRRSTGTTLGSIYPSLGAGTAIRITSSSRTDSLFPVQVGSETQYRSRLASGIPYTPGESLAVVIPGGSGDRSYPPISFKGKTAEAFSVQNFGTPVAGTRINLAWTPGQDLNGTMVFSFRYAAAGVDTLSKEIYCQFRDDGTDTIPGKYVGAWVASSQHTWLASRVRTYVAGVAKGGYFDFISAYDVPTPAAP